MFAEWNADEFNDAIESTTDAGNSAGVPVSTLTVNIDDIEMRVEQGFDYLTAGAGIALVMEGIDRAIEEYGAALAQSYSSSR